MALPVSSRPRFGQRIMNLLPVPMTPRSRRSEYPTVDLELYDLDRCHDRAEKALTETINAYGKLDGDIDVKRWKSLQSKRGVRLFRGGNSVRHTPILCIGTLHARFNDVLEGLYCDNTEDMQLMNTFLCPRLADGSVLEVVQKKSRTEPYAFTGIKWATIKLTMGNNRDLCYFDKMGMVRQATGKRMAYHVMQSVDVADPSYKVKHQRAHVSLCYLFEELEDDLVGVYMKGEIDVGTQSYFVTKAMSDVLLAFVNALECTRAKKLALMAAANSLGAWHSSFRKSCHICKGSSSIFSSYVSCTGCSKPVCKKCRFRETILVCGTLGHTKRADFCRQCFSKMNLLSVDQLRLEAATDQQEDVEVSTIPGSERSLVSFDLNISMRVHVLGSHSDVRASNLSSIGWASSDEEGEEVNIDNESEGRDVLNSSRLKSTPVVIYEKAPVTRRSRSSTTSTSSSHADDTEQHQTSLMAKLQQMSNQVEETLQFTREQSAVARSVRERSRSNRLMQERMSAGSASSIISM